MQPKKSVDSIGRVRPHSYHDKYEKRRFQEREQRPGHSLHIRQAKKQEQHIYVMLVIQNLMKSIQLQTMCVRNKDYADIWSKIMENWNHFDDNSELEDESTYDEIISDDKWNEIMQANALDGEDVETEQRTENEKCTGDPDQPIYPGHTLTVQTSMILILLFTLCHGISGTQLTDLLTLISIHCLHPHSGIKSVYVFKTFFADVKSPVRKHFTALFACLH